MNTINIWNHYLINAISFDIPTAISWATENIIIKHYTLHPYIFRQHNLIFQKKELILIHAISRK